jgi:predicted DNA-binding mobile mystery protein A
MLPKLIYAGVIVSSQDKSIFRAMLRKHYEDIANSTIELKNAPSVPSEGWVRAIRKALDMSGAQLAKRLKVSRNRVSVLERREVDGNITINQLKDLADKLNCDFKYALVPKKDVQLILESRAEALAKEQVSIISQTMYLESQTIDAEKEKLLVSELKINLLRSGGKVLWKL